MPQVFPPTLVKAQVVDIRRQSSSLPKDVVADANVLYVINYDFTALEAAGYRVPSRYQTRHYPAWWKRAVQAGVTLCAAACSLAEFAHIMERTELQNLWRTDPSQPVLDPDRPCDEFSPRCTKAARYFYHSQIRSIRESVETSLDSIRKNVHVLPRVGGDEEVLNRVIRAWVPSTADFGDADLVATAKRAGMPRIISDDADLVSFEGITVYTANQNAVDAARNGGRLLS